MEHFTQQEMQPSEQMLLTIRLMARLCWRNIDGENADKNYLN